MWYDLRYGIRTLARMPGFSAAAILCLALGIGANTAIFSLLDAAVLRRLPVADPERLVLVHALDPKGGGSGRTYSHPLFDYLRRNASGVSGMFAYASIELNLSAGDVTDTPSAIAVSADYFQVLGVRPAIGRTILPGDDAVAVLSHSLWRTRFGGDPDITARTILLNGLSFTVAGVAPPQFFGVEIGRSPDMFVPLAAYDRLIPGTPRLPRPNNFWLNVMARLPSDGTIEQATAHLNAVYRQGWRNHAPGISPGLARFLESRRIVLAPGDKGVRSIGAQFETPLVILMSVVSVVLLIACANVANLLLARAAARRREMAIRLALGAARRRLVRQLLIEGLLLSAAGGTLGLLLAIWSARGLVSVLPRTVLDVGPDARVLGFTILVSVLTTIVFGIVPALRATRPDLTPAWKGPQAADAWGSRARLGRVLASGQVAMSLLLLIAAGLFIRTLGNLRGLDAGFHGEHVLLASMNPNLSRYSSERTDVFYADLVDRVSALPGVQAATIADAPLLGSAYVDGFSVEPSTESAETSLRVVAPRFFETMGIAIRQGRDFTGGDDSRSPKVAIINETIARKFFAGTNPVGRRIGVAGSSGVEIVGVIADTRYRGLRQAVPNIVYLPIAQVPRGADRTVHIRTAGPPASIADAVRAQVRALDATLPVRIRPFTDLVDEDLAQERLIASLSGFFGVLALALTSIGLYGVIAYGVQRRTREIGIRMALGARRSTVLGMVLRDCLGVVAAGIAIGIPASLWLTRLVTRQLFGVEPADPSTIATMTLSIAGVAFLAAVVPARRASRVDPSTALRTE